MLSDRHTLAWRHDITSSKSPRARPDFPASAPVNRWKGIAVRQPRGFRRCRTSIATLRTASIRTSGWAKSARSPSTRVCAPTCCASTITWCSGLAITGLAALGIYMLSVTGEMASAAKIMRNGAEVPARIAGGMYLTPLGYTLFVSPMKWVIMLAPLAMVFVLSFGIERMRPATAQVAVLDLRGADGRFRSARSSWCTRTPRSRGCSSSPLRRSARSACGATPPSATLPAWARS